MEQSLSYIANPLRIHLNYVTAILSRRSGDGERAFTELLNEHDFNSAEIFYHGLNGLYRAIGVHNNNASKFNEHDLPRLHKASIKEELLELYTQVVEQYTAMLSKIPLTDKHKLIPSPLSGKDVKISDWFDTCVMHGIHHIGQALRIHGMVTKKIYGIDFERKESRDYQLFN